MRALLSMLLLSLSLWGQQTVLSGGGTVRGSAVFGGNNGPALPATLLLNWNRSLAATPASGSVICVGTPVNPSLLPGGSCGSTVAGTTAGLQSALNSAVCGNIINVSNSVSLANFTLPTGAQYNCSLANWIWLTRDLSDATFPAEGTRVDPSYAGIKQSTIPQYGYPTANPTPNTAARHMPQITSVASTANAGIRLSIPSSGAGTPSLSYWRLIGFQLGRDGSADLLTSLLDLNFQPANTGQDCEISGSGNTALPVNGFACMMDQPHHIIIDRFFFAGDAQRQTTRAIALGGTTWIAIQDSFGIDIQLSFAGGGGDAQFIQAGAGHGYSNIGFYKFENNATWASTMASLFCGSYVEPILPSTGADGVPHDVQFDLDYMGKNPLWNPQNGQTLNETEVIEGQSYSAVADQELVVSPIALQLQQGASFQINNTWQNDSGGGINRMNDAGGAGSVTIDGTSYTVGNSANGILTKTGEHNVGSSPWAMANAVTWVYTACSGAAIPIAACTAATTAGAHTVTFNQKTQDSRFATLGGNRTLSSTVTVTVTSGAPTPLIALTPSTPDLKLQPSYSDGFGNSRQYCYLFFESANYTQGALTWTVDTVTNGNPTLGTISTGAGLVTGEAVYCSGTGLGSHTIAVTDGMASKSQVITVSSTAPILAYDGKAFTSKNGWEAKCIVRGLLEKSLIVLGWGSVGNGGGQNGNCMLNQPASSQLTDGSGVNVGYGPPIEQDFTARNLHFIHFGDGIVAAALNIGRGIHRMRYYNLFIEDLNAARWSNGFLPTSTDVFAQISGTASTTVLGWTGPLNPLFEGVSFDHITSVGGTPTTKGLSSLFAIANNNAQFRLGAFQLTNSIIVAPGNIPFTNNNGNSNNCAAGPPNGTTNIATVNNSTEANALQGAGYSPAAPCFSQYSLARNAIVDNTSAVGNFSSLVWQPASSDATLFTSYNGGNGGNYQVPSGSQYAAGGARCSADGCLALGDDIAGQLAIDAQVRSGVRTP